MKSFFLAFMLMLPASAIISQVTIDSVESAPHPSAMLHIKSGTKGLLVPRLSSSQMNSIASPAAGLLIYNVDDQAFYYYKGEVGWVLLISDWETDGLDLPFNRTANSSQNLFGITQLSNTNSAASFSINNPASLKPVTVIENQGIGNGLSISLPNVSNGNRGIDVNLAGNGSGVFAESQGGNGIWGITHYANAAGILGDNTFGEAVVGRNRGAIEVGAVVGRNDSSGCGVKGWNTKNGIGVLGQSGISGGTGVGGRFENVNATSGGTGLEAATNGTGYAANFTSSINTAASKGLRIATAANVGGTALTIASGKVVASYTDPYVSNGTIDDLYLIVRAAGNTVLSSNNIALGTIVYVVNFSGGTVTITNTTTTNINIANGAVSQFIFFGAGVWSPVQ